MSFPLVHNESAAFETLHVTRNVDKRRFQSYRLLLPPITRFSALGKPICLRSSDGRDELYKGKVLNRSQEYHFLSS